MVSIAIIGCSKTIPKDAAKFAIKFHRPTPTVIILFTHPITIFPIRAPAVAITPHITPVALIVVPCTLLIAATTM